MKFASYIFVFLAGAVLSDFTRPNAATRELPAVNSASLPTSRMPLPAANKRLARAAVVDVSDSAQQPAVAAPDFLNPPLAWDAMTWQVVDGEVKPRFYCSSRCRRELDKRGLR